MKILSKITALYIWVLRGTPLLLQIFVIFFGLPAVGIKIFDRMPSVYVAFVLNYAAYFGEIFRSGIQSIERGQTEAATLLGFTPFQTNMKIILPQVIKRTLPSIGNEIITLIKDTSLVYVVGVADVFKISKSIMTRDGNILAYVVVGIIYLLLTAVITKLIGLAEKKVYYEE